MSRKRLDLSLSTQPQLTLSADAGPPVRSSWPTGGNPLVAEVRPLICRHVATASDTRDGRGRLLDGGGERAPGRACADAHPGGVPARLLPPHRLGRRRSLHRALLPGVPRRPVPAVARVAV